MGIGTFGAFTQARLAIYAAQTGLSVTGNNISNINTPGYTRQRLNQVSLSVAGSDRWYAMGDVRTGQGVLARSLSQIRNPYLDIRYREENAKVGYYNAKLGALNSIAQVLDEVGKGVDDEQGFGVIALEISKLISALQDLTTETGHQEYDNIVRQVASNLAGRLNAYAARLEEVRRDTETSLNSNLDRINDILNSIRTYNEEIRICDIHGDPALELRDERNLLLDELSGLIDINVTYGEEKIAAGITVEKLIVRLGNANPDAGIHTDESLLIDGIYAAQLSMGKPVDNPYYKMDKMSAEWQDLTNKLRTDIENQLRALKEGEDEGKYDALGEFEDINELIKEITADLQALDKDAGLDDIGTYIEQLKKQLEELDESDDEYADKSADLTNKLKLAEKLKLAKEYEKAKGKYDALSGIIDIDAYIKENEGLQEGDTGYDILALAKQFVEERDGMLKEALEPYETSPYWNEKTKEPVSDIRDATIVTGDNYDVMVTALKNKIGELYQTTKNLGVEAIDPDSDTYKYLESLTGWSNNKKTEETTDKYGNTTITIYTRSITGYDHVKVKDGEDGEEDTYEDVPIYGYTKQTYVTEVSKPVALEDNDLGGEFQGNRELLTEKGEFVDQSVIFGVDKNAASKRGIQYYQRSLDLLAQKLAETLNAANQGFLTDPSGNYIDKEGNPITFTITDPEGDGTATIEYALNPSTDLSDPDLKEVRDKILAEVDPDGLGLPAGMTDKDLLNAYLKGQTLIENEDGNGVKVVELSEYDEENSKGIFVGGPLFSNSNDGNDTTNITAANISISAKWQTSHILVCDFTCPDGETEPASGASENIRHMVNLLDTQKWDFNAKDLASTSGASEGPMFNGTFFEYWNNVGFTLGKDQDYANTELNVSYETALAIDTDRSSVSSVDFNDEAMNLMMYSKSYNAACRLMTTIDSMLDKLINGTGMTT